MSVERPAAGYKFLVVDDTPFYRRLIVEMLRASGAAHVDQADSAEACVGALHFSSPYVLITDWDMAGEDGDSLVRRLRAGALGDGLKRLPVVMVAERNRVGDVERARKSGVDEFLTRPFNTAALLARIESVTTQRRDFIESVVYVGPCRRRRPSAEYDGPLRRLFDADGVGADTPDTQIKKGLARMYADRILALLPAATPQNRAGMRELSLACAQLQTLCASLGERLLLTASDSLLQYVRGVGAEGQQAEGGEWEEAGHWISSKNS